MVFKMIRLKPYGQIFNRVIKFIFIDMMNNAIFRKIAKIIKGYSSVLQDAAFFISQWMTRALFRNISIVAYSKPALKNWIIYSPESNVLTFFRTEFTESFRGIKFEFSFAYQAICDFFHREIIHYGTLRKKRFIYAI